MQFEIPRSTATFAVFHPRDEKNKGMACDIPFRITIDAKYLPMLAPPQLAEGEIESADNFINELWSVEGYPRRPHLSPLKIHRKPEGVAVSIHDDAKKGPLKLDGCTLNKLEVELRSPHQIVLSGQIQHSKYSDKELVRINALSNKTFDIEISIPQSDLFDAPPADDKKDGEQTGDEHPDPDAQNTSEEREPGSDDDKDEKVTPIRGGKKKKRSKRSASEADDEEQDPEE